MVWYSHLFKNFPHFIVIHTVKGSRVLISYQFFTCICANSNLLILPIPLSFLPWYP